MFKNGTFRPGANLAYLLQNAAQCKLQKGVKENIVQQVRWKGLICNKWKKIQITERAKHCKRLYCEKIIYWNGMAPKYFWKLFIGAKEHSRRFGGIGASCGPDIWILEQPRRLNLGELGNWTKGPALVPRAQSSPCLFC